MTHWASGMSSDLSRGLHTAKEYPQVTNGIQTTKPSIRSVGRKQCVCFDCPPLGRLRLLTGASCVSFLCPSASTMAVWAQPWCQSSLCARYGQSIFIYIYKYLYVYAYIGLKSKWHIMKIWQRHAIEALLKQVRPLLFATRRCSRLSGREDIHDERKEWETPSWTIAVDHYHIKLLWLTFSSRCLLFVFWCLWSVFGALPLVWRNTLREITMQWLVGWSQLADPLAYISVVEQTCSPCWWHLPPTTHHCVENQGTQEAPFEPQLGGASVFVRKVRSQSSDWQTNTPRIAQRVTEERVRRKEDPTAWHVKEITLCSSEGLVVPDGWWH